METIIRHAGAGARGVALQVQDDQLHLKFAHGRTWRSATIRYEPASDLYRVTRWTISPRTAELRIIGSASLDAEALEDHLLDWWHGKDAPMKGLVRAASRR